MALNQRSAVWTQWIYLMIILLSSHAYHCAELTDWTTQYCNSFNSQAVVKNGSIWIDGGTVAFYNWSLSNLVQINNSNTLGYNNKVLKLDLTRNWQFNWAFTADGTAQTLFTTWDKSQRSRYGNIVPIVNRGALFAGPDSDTLWRYGGTVSYLNQSAVTWRAPDPLNRTLWSFQPSTGLWTEHLSQDVFGYVPEIPNAGAVAEAPDLGLAFYIHGQVDRGSALERNGLGPASFPLSGMIVIDTRKGTARNLSTDSLVPKVPTTRAGAIVVPNVGTHGIIVKMGGSLYASQNDTYPTNPGPGFLDFRMLNVFDIGQLFNDSTKNNPVWYQQNATGDIPGPRYNFCLVTVSAPDNSSHNIYLYGGTNGIGVYATIYVLSLPSFTWTKIHDDPWGRAYQSCHLLAGSRIVSIGGTNSPIGWNNFCDSTALGVQVWNMNDVDNKGLSAAWSTNWNATYEPYRVNGNVTQKIGGGPLGGATMKNPDGGFSDSGMAALFGRTPSSTTNLTNDVSSGSANSSNSLKLGLGLGLGLGIPFLIGVCWLVHWLSFKKPWDIDEMKNVQMATIDTPSSNPGEPRE